jgi:anaerobic magnesium-protoporphyrin IX monomethyl ester cyclase
MGESVVLSGGTGVLEVLVRAILSTPPSDGDTLGQGTVPSLGLLYIAANAKRLADLEVSVEDPVAEGLDVAQTTERILSGSPDLVGVGVHSRNILRGTRLVRRLKKERPEIITVLGGIHATLFDKLLLREVPELDLVLRGEAEQSFTELCTRLVQGADVAGVPGLSYRANGEIVSGRPQIILDIDSLPFPDRDSLRYEGYFTSLGGFEFPKVVKATTMLASRGCPFNCTFCTKKLEMTSNYRPRSAGNVLRELLQLREEGYRLVLLADENFTWDLERVHELCQMMRDHKLHRTLRLGFQGSLHHAPQETLNLMQTSGFDLAFLGVESASDAQLRRYRKPANRNQMAQSIRRAKAAHMAVLANFIIGAPDESKEDLEANKEFVRDVLPHISDAYPLVVDPGSALWEKMVGGEEPSTIEDSVSRPIESFPGQPDKQTLHERINDFRQTFSRSWLPSKRRAFDVFDLMFHTPALWLFALPLLKRPTLLTQLFTRGQGTIDFVVD